MLVHKKELFVIVLILAVLAGFCFLSKPALAENSSAAKEDKEIKNKAIEELFYVMKADSVMEQTMDQVSKIFVNEYPEPKEYKEFAEELKNKFNIKEVLRLLIPIYDKYYTYDDIEQLIKFYKSPTGQKFISVAPDMTSELMKVGVEYGKKIAKETKFYQKVVSKSIRTACKCNLKNIATALEMYATDNNGYYPPDLKKLLPDYLAQLPQCPVKGMNYVYEASKNRKNFILYCNGEQHKNLGITGPAYSSKSGLVENIKDASK